MTTFFTVILTIISILSAILLIGIILIQQNKSGGGLGAVSGGMTENMFGASAGNVLTKATTWLAIVFLISTLFLATVKGRMRGGKSLVEDAAIPATVATEAAEAAAAVDSAVKEAAAATEAAATEAAATEAAPAAEAPAENAN